MKKIFTLSFLCGLCAMIDAAANAAVLEWWQQTDICRPNPTKCYVNMGAGFDDGLWDATSNCWGMKLICPEANASTSARLPQPMGRAEIASGVGIKPDFDTATLNGDCFGVRKTTANGSMASGGGTFVNGWCSGILNSVDEILPSGEITLGTQPVCRDLAPNGWVGVLNKRCYGKYYDPADYYIECEGNNLLPSRLIILNGADYTTGTGAFVGNEPIDEKTAQGIFDKMYTVSKRQHAIYYDDK